MSGIKVIKAFGTEESENQRFRKENLSFYRFMRKVLKYDSAAAPVVESGEPEGYDWDQDDDAEWDEEAEPDEGYAEDEEGAGGKPDEEEPFLVIVAGDREGEKFEIDRDRLTIGRGADADVFLSDLAVSREHAAIVRTIDGDYIDDLDSRNGTFVNGRRIAAHLLQHGDSIRIGGTTFEYRTAL